MILCVSAGGLLLARKLFLAKRPSRRRLSTGAALSAAYVNQGGMAMSSAQRRRLSCSSCSLSRGGARNRRSLIKRSGCAAPRASWHQHACIRQRKSCLCLVRDASGRGVARKCHQAISKQRRRMSALWRVPLQAWLSCIGWYMSVCRT